MLFMFCFLFVQKFAFKDSCFRGIFCNSGCLCFIIFAKFQLFVRGVEMTLKVEGPSN